MLLPPPGTAVVQWRNRTATVDELAAAIERAIAEQQGVESKGQGE